MGFNVNFNNKPVIREAQSMQNDGGGGNLGYFEQGEGENEKHKEPIKVFSGSEGEIADSFHHEGEEQNINEDDFSFAKLIAQIILAVKDFFKKVFGN